MLPVVLLSWQTAVGCRTMLTKRQVKTAEETSGTFLPTTGREMEERGWEELDVLLVSGDAYVDHPAFGVSLLGRLLESRGYRVGIVAQPRWNTPEDIARMGRPRLFCGVSSGCLDSMLAHYTAFRKKRRDDAYTPGGQCGSRPNRAVIVYSNLVRQAFPGLPVVIGGIESSLRRAAQYDFWSNSLRRSILLDSKADVLVYGMGERAVLEIAERIGADRDLDGVRGAATVLGASAVELPPDAAELPSYEAIEAEPTALLSATLRIERQVLQGGPSLVQRHGKRVVCLNPPAEPLTEVEFDAIYELPFVRDAHPSYKETIPALDMVRWSITAVRGCAGGCSFCSLALHQGRRIRSRSKGSILHEVSTMAENGAFRGAISDIGGPTANLWGARCKGETETCHRSSCLSPAICPHLDVPQGDYLKLLRSVRKQAGVKHVRVASGIRYDLALQCPEFARGLIAEFVGGQLKLAPEHTVDRVLGLMRKTRFDLFERFLKVFASVNKETGREQYIVPYIMSAFPGCTMADMKALATWFKKQGWRPQQVQCFIPTPGTVATAMYYAECDAKGSPIPVAKTDRERQDQHGVLAERRGSGPGRRHRGKRG